MLEINKIGVDKMEIQKYIIMFLVLLLNFVMGIINIERGSYYYAALSFTAVGFIAGVTATLIIDDM